MSAPKTSTWGPVLDANTPALSEMRSRADCLDANKSFRQKYESDFFFFLNII